MPSKTPPSGFRLSEEARRLLAALAERMGVSKTAVMEIAIREKAKREKVEEDD